jgi:transposase
LKPPHTIGVNISKSHLDAFNNEHQQARHFDITARGFHAFERWLRTLRIARVVYEPTGPYYRNLEERTPEV